MLLPSRVGKKYRKCKYILKFSEQNSPPQRLISMDESTMDLTIYHCICNISLHYQMVWCHVWLIRDHKLCHISQYKGDSLDSRSPMCMWQTILPRFLGHISLYKVQEYKYFLTQEINSISKTECDKRDKSTSVQVMTWALIQYKECPSRYNDLHYKER